MDLSRTSLAQARRRLLGGGAVPERAARVRLVAATADHLPVRDRSADAVLMGNAIHYFKNPGRLLDEIHRVLRPGGLFAFNTSFYAGTFLPGTERFYEEWVKEAVKFILRRDAEDRRQGRPSITRTRGRGEAPFSRHWPSPAEYEGTLEIHAFEIRSVRQRTALMTRSSFEAIGAYDGCAAALLSGFPVALAAEALARSVAPVLQTCGRETRRHRCSALRRRPSDRSRTGWRSSPAAAAASAVPSASPWRAPARASSRSGDPPPAWTKRSNRRGAPAGAASCPSSSTSAGRRT
ncbi:MAG: hypothetical protein AUG09_03045 [Acidobacteria bacterium 13_1_20CM_2_68_7]|nr:MAG: hypothetical protein AUG09_03045 [Acidobacteria bacterium 13_1_20CM_2_68_7]